jgi:hypothetical protein
MKGDFMKKLFRVYLNNLGMINLCKGGLKMEGLLGQKLDLGVKISMNYEELHTFMEANPHIKLEKGMIKDSHFVYGGIVMDN